MGHVPVEIQDQETQTQSLSGPTFRFQNSGHMPIWFQNRILQTT